MRFPPVVPEVPVASLTDALAYYRDRLGFAVDWSDEQLAGVSQGGARIFLAATVHRAAAGNSAPIVMWVNLDGRAEVDALHERWTAAGAAIVAAPEAKPYKLYEFFARDLDGNVLRVFYDFAWEERA